jgi:lipopolysaccharide export LptBFGC system permease protein LptF
MVYERDPATSAFTRVFFADKARRQGKQWILTNCVIHEFDSKKHLLIESRPVKEVIIRPKKAPDIVFTPQKSNAWEMTTAELRRLIDDQEAKGLRTMSLQTWRVEYCHKFSLPLSALAAALVAAPLALRFARSGSFAGFLIAVTLVFFYQGFDGWFVIMGYRGFIPPLLAAWATNLLYGSSALFLLSRER